MTTRTGRDICENALKLIGKASQGQPVPAETLSDTFDMLVDMLDSWSVARTNIMRLTTVEHPLTASDGTYTIGPSGADITSPVPIDIPVASIRDSAGIETPLRKTGPRIYREYSYKSVVASRPGRFRYTRDGSLGYIDLLTLPTGGYTAVLECLLPLADVTLSDTLAYPDHYHLAIRFKLAEHIAPMYGRQDHVSRKSFKDLSRDAYARMKAGSTTRNHLKIDRAILHRGGRFGGGYDIEGG